MKWKYKPLGEVADSCLGKMLDARKNKGEPKHYLANINVRWGSFDLENLREMRFEEREKERYGLRSGDIVMCEGGEPGRCAIWKDDAPDIMIQKALHRIRPHPMLDSRFLFYYFLLTGRNGGFDGLFTGSTIKHLTGKNLAKLMVPVPPLPTQTRIADILSAYDDLIENNKRRMQLLEEAARQLYREWFVRLRFPGHEHTRIVNGLPEGWERKPLGKLCSFLKRGITPRYDEDAQGIVINQKCIRNGRVDLSLARRQAKEVPKPKVVLPGDVLVNSTGEGTLGRVAQLWTIPENCTVDTHVTIVRAIDEFPLHYFGQSVREWEPQLGTMGRGATNQTELSPATIAELPILVPSETILHLFEESVADSTLQVENLTLQNQKLRAARDLLLPKLMNGEIAV